MIRFALSCLLIFISSSAWGYPLDAAETTGITRLDGYRLLQAEAPSARKLPPGALWDSARVQLRLQNRTPLTLPEPDPELTAEIVALLGEEQENYSLSLLDLSQPHRPVYAEHQGEKDFNPGSLGKILIALGIFQALADLYPDDLEARRQILREQRITADQFIQTDRHKVPFWDAERQRMQYRPIRIGDSGNLWTWLDWMLSPSSNAAAAMVMREYLLMMEFGPQYPVSDQVADQFFETRSKKQLMQLLLHSLREPQLRNGLDPEQLRQGGFFTRKGKQLVPGGGSRATTRSFLRLMLKIEQGQLIDAFSSLELKRLLYMTEKRIRYASHPALQNSAVYFKSGSLYSCIPEPDFKCGKYQGNKRNLLNSVATIEEPQENGMLHYLVVVTSNVLRVNSAVAHQTLAMRIHRLLQKRNEELFRKKVSAE